MAVSRTLLGRVLAVLALVVAVVGWVVVSPRAVLSSLAALASDPLWFGLGVTALYLLRPFLAIPTMLCSAVVGYGYGVYGLPLALAGAALTSLPPFYLARWALDSEALGDRSGLVGLVGGSADRVRAAGQEYFAATGGVRGVTAARLAPVPADLVTCGAGAAGVSVSALLAGTVLGEVPWTVGAVLLGASAGRLAAPERLGSVGWPVFAGALLGAALLLAGPTYQFFRRSVW